MTRKPKKLTYAEIEKLYPNEWVLLEDPKRDPKDIAKAGGRVLLHHADKKTLHELAHQIVVQRKALDNTTPVHYAMIYAGNLQVTSRPWLHATIIPESRKTN